MPIVVTCPGCPTKLSAPDSAAGKQIRCPKCGAVAPVPNFIPAEAVEEEVVEAKVAPAKPKPKPLEAEAVEEERPRKKASRRDEDDEDEPPRKKKRRYDDDDDDYAHDHPRRRRRSGGGGGNGGKIAAFIIVGVLVLAGIGVGVYFLTGKGSLLAKKAPVPKGWKQHSFPEEGIAMYAPQKPARIGLNLTRTPADRGGRFGQFGGDDFDELELLSSFASGNLNEVRVEIAVIRFRDRVPASVRDRVENILPDQFRGGQMRSVRWLGATGQEWTRQGWVVRVVCTGRYAVVAAIRGANDTRVTREEEDGFFDNFELTK